MNNQAKETFTQVEPHEVQNARLLGYECPEFGDAPARAKTKTEYFARVTELVFAGDPARARGDIAKILVMARLKVGSKIRPVIAAQATTTQQIVANKCLQIC